VHLETIPHCIIVYTLSYPESEYYYDAGNNEFTGILSTVIYYVSIILTIIRE